MPELRPITVVGGGLAGLTLGIGLRQRGIPVTVWEAGDYPRHRVCGEFISGRGQQVLERLGLRGAFLEAGSITARTGAFFLGERCSPVRPLPSPALCLSRYIMDAQLARAFRALGGDLRENARWRERGLGEGIVRASGRRSVPVEDGWRWIGLKVHARNVAPAADLEMHASATGYVGVCRLAGGKANVCGLFRRPAASHQPAPPWQDLLRGEPGSALHARLGQAEFDEASFRAVAGLALRPQPAAEQTECVIGDTLTMIPPVTGNGMSMAFESAEIAIEPVAAYSRAEISWGRAQQTIARRCDERFAPRLTWAAWLQWLMFTRLLKGPLGHLALDSEWLWRTMFARTR